MLPGKKSLSIACSPRHRKNSFRRPVPCGMLIFTLNSSATSSMVSNDPLIILVEYPIPDHPVPEQMSPQTVGLLGIPFSSTHPTVKHSSSGTLPKCLPDISTPVWQAEPLVSNLCSQSILRCCVEAWRYKQKCFRCAETPVHTTSTKTELSSSKCDKAYLG